MIVYLPATVLAIGILMYALCVNGKLAEIGRLMFAIGLLVFLLSDKALLLR